MVEKDIRFLKEDEFEQVYEYLKDKTNSFTEFSPDLIIENNQFLLIFRIILGMSQKEFAEKLSVTKDWCRHTEAGRNKIVHIAIAERYSYRIEKLLKNKKINLESSLNFHKKYLFYSKNQKLPEAEIKFKAFSLMDEEELIHYFDIVKKETNNFTYFDPNLLIRIPQSLTIFRIILCMSYRKLGKVLRIDQSYLRRFEHLEIKPKPITRDYFITKIEDLFKHITIKDIALDKVLENFRIL